MKRKELDLHVLAEIKPCDVTYDWRGSSFLSLSSSSAPLGPSGVPRTAAEDQEGAAQPVFRAELHLQPGAALQAPVWREVSVQRQVKQHSLQHAHRNLVRAHSSHCRITTLAINPSEHPLIASIYSVYFTIYKPESSSARFICPTFGCFIRGESYV